MLVKSSLKPCRWDLLVAGAVAALAVITGIVFYGAQTGGGALSAVITHRGTEVERIDLTRLTKETEITVSGVYTLHICADSAGIAVTQADCPTQDCVHTGRITRPGQSIVCLPEQVVIHLEGRSDDAPDVIVG